MSISKPATFYRQKPTTESEKDPLLTDRTTIETDWACGMRRWWYKEESGTGIIPVEEAVYFTEGRDIHEDFQLLADESADPEKRAVELIDAIKDRMDAAGGDQLKLESLCRRAGWVAANALYVEPVWRRDYVNVYLEHELVLGRGDLWILVTPDRVGRHRQTRKLVYRDYKGVGGWGATQNWVAHWPYAIQQHTVLKAIEEELHEPVAYGQIMGLVKGQERDGKLRHPYVWAYSDGGSDWETDYYIAKRKGLTLTPVWEYPGGILEWVRRLGPEVATSQFPFSTPIFLNERLLADLVVSRTRREQMVKLVRKSAQVDRTTRAKHFEPRFSECRPSFGAACPYLAACHNATVNEDPLASGLFVRRTPHHELEILSKGDFNQ